MGILIESAILFLAIFRRDVQKMFIIVFIIAKN